MAFDRTKMRITSEGESQLLFIEFKNYQDDLWQHCMTIPAAIDFPSYYVMAASTERTAPNFHYVYSVQFWDSDGPEKNAKKFDDQHHIEDEDIEIGKQEFIPHGADLLHLINTDSDLAKDKTKVISAYNDQLIAHNNRYAKLIGSVYRNQHIAENLVESFPDQNFLKNVTSTIAEFKILQDGFTNNFKGVKEIINRATTGLEADISVPRPSTDELNIKDDEAVLSYELN